MYDINLVPASSTENLLTVQMASGGGKLEQPMHNAVGNAQDSVNAALDYLGRVAADVSCHPKSLGSIPAPKSCQLTVLCLS